jgi:hypothetical protein
MNYSFLRETGSQEGYILPFAPNNRYIGPHHRPQCARAVPFV